MKRPGFLHGVIVAAVLGFFASAIVATLTPFAGLGAVVRLVIPMLGLAYLLYLLNRSAERREGSQAESRAILTTRTRRQ